MNPKIIEALGVTCALTATEMPEAAVRVMAGDLAGYPEGAVLAALVRCRRELTGRLSLAAVIERIDDGRPGAEEAWAACPKSERESVVWTPEWAAAYWICAVHIDRGDLVAGRMAFLEAYRKRVTEARAKALPVTWKLSQGYDKIGREIAVLDAVRVGRISAERAMALLPTITPGYVAHMLEHGLPKLPPRVAL